jgi:hypothetical protein
VDARGGVFGNSASGVTQPRTAPGRHSHEQAPSGNREGNEVRPPAAIREWIDRVAGDRERPDLAAALAMLAAGPAEAVESRFLEPWSRGTLGTAGKATASYVLWWMCDEESTATRAMRIAVRWAESDDADQRVTAMMAFSGELGVAFPAEAAGRLWHLMTRTGELCVGGFSALARLFAVLVDQAGAAGAVLATLDAQRERYCLDGGPRWMCRITVEAILAVLMAQSHRTARPAVAEFLHLQPDRAPVVARLWAAVLRSPRTGEDGLAALWSTVCALERISGDIVQVEQLSRALSAPLSDDEHRRLHGDLTTLVSQLRPEDGQVQAALLAAFVLAGIR